VFLTDRRARVELPTADRDRDSDRARLSYRRAAECFEQASEKLPGGPWTLHQLRHSALTRISAQLVRGTDRRVGRARLWVGCAR
jgi:hypothetical protein